MPHWSFPQMCTLSFHGVAGCPAVTTGEGALWHGVPQTLELWESETSTSLRSLRSDTLQRILQDIGWDASSVWQGPLQMQSIVIGGSIYDGGILRWNFTRDRLRELHLDFFGCRSAFLFSKRDWSLARFSLGCSIQSALSSSAGFVQQALFGRALAPPGIAPESDTSVCFRARSWGHIIIILSLFISQICCAITCDTSEVLPHNSRFPLVSRGVFLNLSSCVALIKEQPGDPWGYDVCWCFSNMEACV